MTAFHTLMNASRPGTMVQHLFSIDAGRAWQAGLAIREDWATLTGFPARVDLRSRGALLQIESVHLIVLLLRIQAGPIYESLVSLQHADSPDFIARMAAQETLSILLFDGIAAQPVRRFETRNGYQRLFQYVLRHAAGWPGWADAAFDQAKASLYRRYPTVAILWHALGQHAGSSGDIGLAG